MERAGAAIIDSSWPMMEARTLHCVRSWRTSWSRKCAYTWESQKTSRVVMVAVRMRYGDLPPAEAAAIIAQVTIVP